MLPQVYLRPYKLEEYEALVRPLGLWPYPRGHQRHLTELPVHGATVLLADQRSCPVLPERLRIRAHPGLQPTAAMRAMDCDTACRQDTAIHPGENLRLPLQTPRQELLKFI